MVLCPDVRKFVAELGEPYSAMLGINLSEGDGAYAKWFLAAFLYAKPIREESATRTYHVFEAHGLTTATTIAHASRETLIKRLGEGGYARYDESTSTRLLTIFGHLLQEYDGKFGRLYDASKESRDLEQLIMGLGKGIGPVTVSVFLRDMRPVWSKADPKPTPRVMEAAMELGIGDIGKYAQGHHIDRVRLETALHRYSKKLRISLLTGKKSKTHYL